MIAALPERYRLALVAVDLVGLSHREAAVSLETSEATIATRVFRAREQVARRLTPEGEDTPGEAPAPEDSPGEAPALDEEATPGEAPAPEDEATPGGEPASDEGPAPENAAPEAQPAAGSEPAPEDRSAAAVRAQREDRPPRAASYGARAPMSHKHEDTHAELAALADGTLPAARREQSLAQVADSPDLASELESPAPRRGDRALAGERPGPPSAAPLRRDGDGWRGGAWERQSPLHPHSAPAAHGACATAGGCRGGAGGGCSGGGGPGADGRLGHPHRGTHSAAGRERGGAPLDAAAAAAEPA